MGRSENKELDQAVQGKTREAKAKRVLYVDEHGVTLAAVFATGTYQVNLPGSLLHQFAGIGLSAVVGEVINKAKSVEDAVQAFNELAVRIESGEFKRSERRAAAAKEPSDIVLAIAEAAGWSVEKAAQVYAGADRATKAALRSDHRTKAALARLRGQEVKSADTVDFGAYED